MSTLIIRSIFLYILLLGVFRLMGKRQIGQLQPFELVLTLVIADLATIPMSETAIPLLHGVVPLLTLMCLHFLITVVTQKSNKLNKLVNGKPIIVVTPKGVDYAKLKSLNISIDDLMEAIRGAGFFSLAEVEYAIVETTGNVNVMPKSEFAPATNQSLKIKAEKQTLPINLIIEGKIQEENIELASATKQLINQIMKIAKIKKIENVLVCSIDDLGMVYIQEKNKPFHYFEIDHKDKNKI